MDYEIVIPCFNQEKSIQTSVLSALNQSIQPRNVIVHDNKSQDNSKFLVEELLPTHKKLQLVSHENHVDVRESFLRAINRSVGRILILAGDDILARDAVECLLKETKCENIYHSIVPQQVFSGGPQLTRGADFSKIMKQKKREYQFLINPADNPFIYGLHNASILRKCCPDSSFYGLDLLWSYNILRSTEVHFVPQKTVYIREFSPATKYARERHQKIEKVFPFWHLSKFLMSQKETSKIILLERVIFLNLHESLSLNRFGLNRKYVNAFRKILGLRVWNSRYRKSINSSRSKL